MRHPHRSISITQRTNASGVSSNGRSEPITRALSEHVDRAQAALDLGDRRIPVLRQGDVQHAFDHLGGAGLEATADGLQPRRAGAGHGDARALLAKASARPAPMQQQQQPPVLSTTLSRNSVIAGQRAVAASCSATKAISSMPVRGSRRPAVETTSSQWAARSSTEGGAGSDAAHPRGMPRTART